MISVQFNDFQCIYRVVQSSPQSNFKNISETFPSPQTTVFRVLVCSQSRPRVPSSGQALPCVPPAETCLLMLCMSGLRGEAFTEHNVLDVIHAAGQHSAPSYPRACLPHVNATFCASSHPLRNVHPSPREDLCFHFFGVLISLLGCYTSATDWVA